MEARTMQAVLGMSKNSRNLRKGYVFQVVKNSMQGCCTLDTFTCTLLKFNVNSGTNWQKNMCFHGFFFCDMSIIMSPYI